MNNKRAISAAVSMAAFSLIMILTVVGIYFLFFGTKNGETAKASTEPLPTVVIDAGHGGMDGGCVSDISHSVGATTPTQSSGKILEKDCNLQISKILAALFRVSGYNVVMTRDTDTMLDGEGLSGSAKMRDLRARLDIARRYPDALFISIHCNKFPSPECKGLQVYYSKNHGESKTAADAVQNSVVSLLQPTNKRLTKAADSSIFVLNRATQPAILIECGFLSNEEEAKLLTDTDYQKKLALAIAIPIIEQNTILEDG